jgi:hypothetical protein
MKGDKMDNELQLHDEEDPAFAKSEEIKAEYLSSGCQSSDVDHAVRRLVDECGQLFENGDTAWSFLMEELHENLEVHNEKCANCEGFAGFENSPEGDSCRSCGEWFCSSCIDWAHSGDNGCICKTCVSEGKDE